MFEIGLHCPGGDLIIHTAARLPKLTEVKLGACGREDTYPHPVFHFLHTLPALRRCHLEGQNVTSLGFTDERNTDLLAGSLRQMLHLETHLEDFALDVFVDSISSPDFPMLDALEDAGTSHSCTRLTVDAFEALYNTQEGPKYGVEEATPVHFLCLPLCCMSELNALRVRFVCVGSVCSGTFQSSKVHAAECVPICVSQLKAVVI